MNKILINGCFDMLHTGHIRLLEYASLVPFSYVFVLIDSDRRIKELKGTGRPVYSQTERLYHVSSLKYVDQVDIFDSEQELTEKIKLYSPDIMIKGSEYKNKPIIGSQYCKEIIFYDRIEQYSTTSKIKSIINRRELY